MEFLYNFINKKASIFDAKVFLNNEKNQKKAARFFYSSSQITAFFLFSNWGKTLLGVFLGVNFYFSMGYFTMSVAVFAHLGVIEGTKFLIVNVPFALLLIFVFNIVLMDLTLINTFLICCPSVKNRIKKLYGENFIKQRF